MNKFTDLLPPVGSIDPRLLTVDIFATEYLGDDELSGQLTNWHCSLALAGDTRDWVAEEEPDMAWAAGSDDAVLARARIRIVPLYRGLSLFDVLDSVDSDLAVFVELVDGDGLIDQLDHLATVGSELVIVDRVEVAPQWRGRKLGRLLVAKALATVGGSARLFALTPGAYEQPARTSQRAAADDALIAVWTDLGFESWEREDCEDGPRLMIADGSVVDWAGTALELMELAG